MKTIMENRQSLVAMAERHAAAGMLRAGAWAVASTVASTVALGAEMAAPSDAEWAASRVALAAALAVARESAWESERDAMFAALGAA